MAVTAVQAIRRMRGGAQSQLMLGADGQLWVVKFRNNPQHVRVLANEFIATRLAEAIGLSVPRCDLVDVSPWLIENSPEMVVDAGKGRQERCAAGLQFGSQYVDGGAPGQVVDYLPQSMMEELRNLREFAGMLLIDKWTGNCNGRQAVFERRGRERKYRAMFIDQGFCFNAGEWTFPDVPLRGVFPRNQVYANVCGWMSFEPWLTRVEQFEPERIWAIAEQVPPEWYGGDPGELEALVVALLQRRGRVRELVNRFRESDRRPFPLWGAPESTMVESRFVVSEPGRMMVM